MNKEEMIWVATVAVGKNMDYETLGWSDYMYGKKEYLDDVWEYVMEYEEEGGRAFREKYKEYKQY